MLDEFLDYQLLFGLDVFEEGEYMSYLGQDDLIVVLLAQFMADGEFVGSLHRLVEIASKPAEILLILAEECCHFVKGLQPTDGSEVIELSDGIANHCTHVAVTFSFASKEVILFWSQPHFAYYCSFVHIYTL